MTNCAYCNDPTDRIIWSDGKCRVMYVDDSPFTGWCRVIWHQHLAEMSDLPAADRQHFMAVTFAVESGLRRLLNSAKMNLASLGTGLPHLHWHVIPRFADDTHFPEPVWSAALRASAGRTIPEGFVAAMQSHLDAELA